LPLPDRSNGTRVGVRKSIWLNDVSSFQFIGESMIMATILLIAGIVTADLMLPYYNSLVKPANFKVGQTKAGYVRYFLDFFPSP
jgi:hypothetical protein